MIKILHVIDSMDMGGAQSLLVEMIPVQLKNGNEVAVLQIKDSEDKALINKLEAEGVFVGYISKTRSIRSPINIFTLIPYLKEYDILHVHLFPANYWVALAKLLSFSKTPIVTTEHSTYNKRRGIKIFKYIDTFIYNCYNEVIACSSKAKDLFLKRYSNVNCISIPNGINLKKYIEAEPYSKQELLGISGDLFITTMVARFIPSKRQDTLVEALGLLPNNHHAVFVGGHVSDEGLLKIKALAERLGVSERVHFLYIRSDVHRILKSSNAILMSSEYEGLSLSSIEGMACGHPFIASNVDGLREIVGGAGLLVECGNKEDLARVLIKLESDKNYYNEVVKRCLNRSAEYDIDNVAKMYNMEYLKFVR